MGNMTSAEQDSVIKELFEKYLDCSNPPTRDKKTAELAGIQIKTDTNLTNRENTKGHFTASIFLLCKKTKRVLVLEYKALKMYLPPGGHIGPHETPLEAALRNLAEDTGIKDGFMLRSLIPGNRDVPLNVESYRIPDDPKKDDDGHIHHCFEYLAVVKDEDDVAISSVKDKAYQWTDWDDFVAEERFKEAAVKIEELAYHRSPGAYYESLLDQKTIDTIQKNNYSCLAIQHIVFNSVQFIMFLKAVFGDNLHILAKPRSINQEVMKQLKDSGIDITVANRLDNFEKYISDKTILMDIGGYFTRIAKKKGLAIVGIIEDTEDGLQKYEAIKKEVKYPVVSIARSELRGNDDKLVSDAMVHAVDTILRSRNVVIDYRRCGVIGYGRVEAGVVKSLLKRDIKPYVAESNPVRLINAVNDYCYPASIEYLVNTSEVIFCAADKATLTPEILRKVKDGAFIVSTTSSDSEFDIPALENDYQAEKISDQLTKYANKYNYFFILNKGSAVNFLYGSALGPFVYLELGEELAVINSLTGPRKYKSGVHLSKEDTRNVASMWVDEFVAFRRVSRYRI
jgi:S-adenosylhomocysteine hydrolase/8-oxo-dGTP pyrophosphatase MutT (NUDIX family)